MTGSSHPLSTAPTGLTADAGALAWQGSALKEAMAEFNTLLAGADMGAGSPPVDAAGWFAFERLADESFGEQVIRRIAEYTRATGQAAGTYSLRYALYCPLALAGYLFARAQCVLRLHGNLMVDDRDWLNHIRWTAPSVTALAGSRFAGQGGGETIVGQGQLADALFHEAARLAGPLIDAWSERKWVSRANAWASAIDSLAYGVQLAGRQAGDLDASWVRWEAAVAGRIFPVRRRPRRFLFTCDGQRDELLIRSGCCLWFTQPAAQNSAMRYCTSCYIATDERRLEQILEAKRKQNVTA